MVTKLDRLARSISNARTIADDLAANGAAKGVVLSIGGSAHDPTDPSGRLLFNMLAMFAEFESDLIRARTREGMKVAARKGKLKGGKPKLSPAAERNLVAPVPGRDHAINEPCDLFSIGRTTAYRAVVRHPIQEGGQVTLPRVDDDPDG